MTLARDPHSRTAIDSCGYPNVDRLATRHDSSSSASIARSRDLSRAATAAALRSPADQPSLLTCAVTGRAFNRFVRCLPKAVTGVADVASIDFDLSSQALHRLLKCDIESKFDIGAARLLLGWLRSNVAEYLGKNVPEIRRSEIRKIKDRSASPSASGVFGVVAVAIV